MKERKWLDLLVLLMISGLIVTATAAIYYSLGMTSTIATATTDVWFVKGVDNGTAGVTLSPQNTSANLASLKAYPNASVTYTDPLRVRNNHTSSTYDVRLNPVSLSGNNTEFVYVKFLLREGIYEDNATLASLNYTCDGSIWTIPPTTGWVQIPSSTEYSVTVITMAKDNAASAQVAIEIAIDVQ